MNDTLETRELFVLEGPDCLIRGTYHKACNDNSDHKAKLTEGDRVGVVFLNGLPATRAAHGNAAVYWADSFAERGYPSFRLDLPGFGDSDGDPPTDWLRFINEGRYASAASDAMRQIKERFRLPGIVVVGHCAGAVTAIYAVALDRVCKGMVLIDPYFYAAQKERLKTRQLLSSWAEQSRVGGILRNVFGSLKKNCLSFFKNVYPDHANVPLLRRWKEVTSRGIPVLILKMPDRRAASAKPRARDFDYFKYVVELAGRRGMVAAKSVEGANHTFSNRAGRAAVRQHAEQWLNTYFSIPECRDSGVSTACIESGDAPAEVVSSK